MRDSEDRNTKSDEQALDPFERFASEEERLEALDRFRRWMEKLESWDEIERCSLPGPSVN